MELFLSKRNLFLLYALLALVYISGLFIPLMEHDSAAHAIIAMRMYLENDFIHLYKGAEEYLDKPHAHFWLSALSFKIFGLSHWAYRIPALIFTLIGAYSSYHLAKDFYGSKAGHISSLIFLSTQAIILANHDVRTDAVLTGASIYAIWQLVKYIDSEKLLHAVLGSIGLGIAFSTKGQLAILMIGSALFCYVLYNRKWKTVLSWKVLVGIIAFLITATPMLYAYYLQFDIHPDKLVNGRKNVSGIKFIFWDQSFNRLTGEGFNSNNKDYFFFFHTMLWAFLPWAFITYIAIFDRSKQLIKIRFKYQKGIEFLTLGGFWLVMIIINMSKSKLPHYMNSLLPVLSVLLSGYLVYLVENSKFKKLNVLLYVQYFIIVTGSILVILLVTYIFPASYLMLFIYAVLLFILVHYLFKKMELVPKIIIVSVLFSVFVNFSLNTHFYPSLLKYQAGKNMVEIIHKENINVEDIYIFENRNSWSLNFYTQRHTPGLDLSEVAENKGKWLFVYDKDVDKLKSENVTWDRSYVVPHYRITRLKLSFLNPETRDNELTKAYLLHLN